MTIQSALSKATPSGLKLPTNRTSGHSSVSNGGLKTPKTPQDEALAFFSQTSHGGAEPVQVWELQLEDDGGPAESKSVSLNQLAQSRRQTAVWPSAVRCRAMNETRTDFVQYIRLPPPVRPYVLRLSLQPGTACTRNGVLKSDFPMDGGVFQRGEWKERQLPKDVSKYVPMIRSHVLRADRSRPVDVDLPISAPGAFCYYIEHDGPDPNSPRITGRKGYFNVDPIITLPARNPFFPSGAAPPTEPLDDTSSGAVLNKPVNLTLDGLIILSVLAKWMGPTSAWDAHFAEASGRGYNMLHWAPLQQCGGSGSPYSIYDQLKFDKAILENPGAKDGGLAEIASVLQLAKEKYGLGGVTDVVLNHTAFDSPWLEQHPEAGERSKSPHETGADGLPRIFCAKHPSSCPRCRARGCSSCTVQTPASPGYTYEPRVLV